MRSTSRLTKLWFSRIRGENKSSRTAASIWYWKEHCKTSCSNRRYLAALDNFEQTRQYVDETRTSLTAELEAIESSCIVAESTYSGTFENLLSSQLAVAKKTKPPKYDKDTWLAEVEHQLDNQRQRASEVAKIRLAHVHLQGKLAKMMDRLKQFDSLGPGFSMMDYEYLVKRKSIYSERRDEQRENIKKLKGKNLASAAVRQYHLIISNLTWSRSSG